MPNLQAKMVAFLVCDGAAAGIVASKGIAAIVDNGVGDHSIQLDEALDVNESHITYEARGAGLIAQVVHTDDTHKQLLTLDNAGAAADGAYCICFWRIPPIG